jgi:hypothetical protein
MPFGARKFYLEQSLLYYTKIRSAGNALQNALPTRRKGAKMAVTKDLGDHDGSAVVD